MTLKELSAKTGLSISFLSDAEVGRSNLSIAALEKVAEALGTTSSYLLDSRSMTLESLADMHKIDLPQDIKDYVLKQKSLPYIALIKEVDEKNIIPIDLLKNLIEMFENEAKKVKK
jgi:transcriptional regulator with XRE-family HTH domain